MKLPEMHAVTSSNLHSVGHDGKDLFVRFKGSAKNPEGNAYRYIGCPVRHLDGIRQAGSPGQYLNSEIKPNFQAEKVS